jgi:hypothetical protein
MNRGTKTRAVSVVVPTFNEASNLLELLRRLKAVLAGTFDYEVVLADDRVCMPILTALRVTSD